LADVAAELGVPGHLQGRAELEFLVLAGQLHDALAHPSAGAVDGDDGFHAMTHASMKALRLTPFCRAGARRPRSALPGPRRRRTANRAARTGPWTPGERGSPCRSVRPRRRA